MGPPLPVSSGQCLSLPLGRSPPLGAVWGQGGDEGPGSRGGAFSAFPLLCGSVWSSLNLSFLLCARGRGAAPLLPGSCGGLMTKQRPQEPSRSRALTMSQALYGPHPGDSTQRPRLVLPMRTLCPVEGKPHGAVCGCDRKPGRWGSEAPGCSAAEEVGALGAASPFYRQERFVRTERI